MINRFLEAGKIVNTHGVNGEVKIQPWADSPNFVAGFKRLYIDGRPVELLSARVHKGCVIAALGGVSDFEGAIRLKNKTVYIDRGDVQLGEGRHFVADIAGLRALDVDTGEELGIVSDVLTLPANDVYVIVGEREMLIPAVPDFVREVNIESGYIKIRVIEGL
ncbi:MAG: ribosome maturation factor RimM [Oscillospiraceae bacterium]|nr:ribosome maturation factor RimM [Oscillospiraceae bacterium]